MKIKKKNKKMKMQNNHIYYMIILLALVIALIIARGHKSKTEANEPEPVSHEGQVEVFNGEKTVWISPDENVPVNDIDKSDFARDENGDLRYTGTEYQVVYGIDVSKHQNLIDWTKVRESGIDFAILRAGGRYYSADGDLFEDGLFEVNLKNATEAGIQVGVYFFSQAITEEEAREEADFVIKALGNTEIRLPVFFDWERIAGSEEARTNNLDREILTKCAVAFCEEIEKAGLDAGIYFNLDTGYYGYDMSELTDYTFWCASPGDYPYSYYAHSIWQYSFEGKVQGINYDCDLNMMFLKK